MNTSIYIKNRKFTVVALLAVFFAACGVTSSFAQNIELTPSAGYMWAGRLKGYNGEIRLGEGVNYGVSGSAEVAPASHVEFSWSHLDSDAQIVYYGQLPEDNDNFKVTSNYYLLGVIQESQVGDVRPFGLIQMGASSMKPHDVNYGTEWFFTVAFGGGLKYHFSDRVGIRLQGRLVAPMSWGGGGLWCGTGGCNVGYSSYASVAQGDLSAALIFRFQR